MKKGVAVIAFLLVYTASQAQNSYEINERQMPYNKLATSFTANIEGINENFLLYQWQKFIEYHKGTAYLIAGDEGDLEFESEHVIFPILNNQSVTIHSRFNLNSAESGVLLTIWIQLPDGTYYSSKMDEDSAKKIRDWLLKFDERLTNAH
ncbi:MAG: hypothetical protein MUO53_10370 [Maribacter sp.]|nr:hypothetical protein [Maribacter sp.]